MNCKSNFSISRQNGLKCVDIDESDYKLSQSLNTFDFRIFHQILKDSPQDDNLIFSSHSLASVLSILLLGAQKETNQELRDLLALPCAEENATKSQNLYLEGFKNQLDSMQVASNFFPNLNFPALLEAEKERGKIQICLVYNFYHHYRVMDKFSWNLQIMFT